MKVKLNQFMIIPSKFHDIVFQFYSMKIYFVFLSCNISQISSVIYQY